MPKRGKKKNAALLLVAPEPQGDELEADILWDAIKEVGDKPHFMDSTVLDATYAVFEPDKSRGSPSEVARNLFINRRRNLSLPRARDRFVKAEDSFKKRLEIADGLHGDAKCFAALKLSEKEAFEAQQAAILAHLSDLRSNFLDAQAAFFTDVNRETEKFFKERVELLDDLSVASATDIEVEAVFEEQLRLEERYKQAELQFFKDHGEHTDNANKMVQETRRQQDNMIRSMVMCLGNGVGEMSRLFTEELEDKVAQQEETSRLIVELMKVQRKSLAFEKETISISECAASVQRLIDLEAQKQELCIRRQKQLQEELKLLSDVVKDNDMKMLRLTSNATPCANYVATLPVIPPSPNTIANVTDDKQEKNLTLLTVEARRELENMTVELNELKKELWSLQRRHIAQLGGYAPLLNEDFTTIITARDALLDVDTRAAIRTLVLDTLLEVCQCANHVECVTGAGAEHPLLEIKGLEDRLAIQRLVERRINKLFSYSCPTAPPVVFLQDSRIAE
ncbi:hypothetical protein ERJ75_001003900 [Trypanosoma vivax]|uniref:Uncharacterized protein n=1 Tax=Trypanosoma vivax (strain Y486) TaxID=1055687 RepID=G0UB11_TRYVY|nr:hypothetical protein TRVL_02561 [Trypanosoma vivax]KAH8611936.1 hypothetical protein ERJ75_001003900 [Trypanosoma vivax]CCC52998.1 conserved hypothetical protein [Trypanosoma vivax Y486]